MNWQDRIIRLEAQIKLLRIENDSRRSLLAAACDQIDILHKRVDQLEKKTQGNFEYFEGSLKYMGDKLYPTFYKVFPAAMQAEEALERIVEQSKNKPKP